MYSKSGCTGTVNTATVLRTGHSEDDYLFKRWKIYIKNFGAMRTGNAERYNKSGRTSTVYTATVLRTGNNKDD